ncbi:MAG TPA: helix-turn-helix domain-containing protein [Vicinamibacterales bacterium]
MQSAVLAALASPRRQEILRMIWRDELAAGAIAAAMPDVTFGAVSLQLRTLQNAGLVVCRRDQQNRFYRANREALGPLGASLERMWTGALWRLKLAAELEASRRGPAARRKPARSRRPRTSASSAANSRVKRNREH